MDKYESRGIVEKLTNKSEDLSKWYREVIRLADLADYAPVKGCMVIAPYGYALWEAIQRKLDAEFKRTGHKNAYFPLLIPESLLNKEAEHVEGFAPEVAWVTQGGKDELEERLAIRPTSEAIICHMYSKWINSWRDLPVLINQWCNVIRWEMVTRPFLRTTEFLWQEGHTAHETCDEAEEETLKMLEIYRRFFVEELAIPVLIGRKSEQEKFAGALRTYTVEALMCDGKALQTGTSHNLGQHFAKAFDITFLDEEMKRQHVWSSSWGVSTRIVGALILTHGDDAGLILPPRIAPTQVVIVPIWQDKTRDMVKKEAEKLLSTLEKKFRTEADLRDEYSPGWKFNEHELRGIPIRIEIGPKEIEAKNLSLVRRDNREKTKIKAVDAVREVGKTLTEIQANLLDRATKFREASTHEVNSFDQFKELIEKKRGFILAGWCGNELCENQIREETVATIRLIPFKEQSGKCIKCQKQGNLAYFAKAY